ncbi:NADPH oxidase organizer 1-like [Gadus macrocephalus]|uniref:NADPH oxidase organizer 1-like n=1 Tax=Gadus macrocephalus TaxID=80720 RepID=UPI0028CB8800|nr:NADPH oxidase organizer 1-like [Gadus macrocephalus]
METVVPSLCTTLIAMANQPRHVISSRLIGVMIRSAPNVKMYIVSVVWSDDSEGIIYRSFQEFQKFHGHLKKKFPLLNPLKKSERVIPKFRAHAIKTMLQQNSSRRSVHRMKILDDYCSKLLQCDSSVCQSSEVNLFFTCKDQDLQPDFTKNSIMVLPSGDLSNMQGGGVADVNRPHSGSVTSPFVSQTYRCVAAYETKDTKNRPFSVVHEEVLEVLIKDPAGWWLVENQHKRLAWFPAPYLQMFKEDSNDDDDDHNDLEEALLEGGAALYLAVRTFTGQKADEVSVPIGAVVSVLRMTKDGWWLVRYNDKAGFIPSMYLKPYSNPQACLHSLQRKLHSSTLNLASPALEETQAGGRPMPSLSEHREPEGGSPGQSSGQQEKMSRLREAHSLDLLSESDRVRSFSLDECASAPGGKAQVPPRRPRGYSASSAGSGISAADSRLSDQSTSTASLGPGSPKGAAGGTPTVPARPKPQEILTRCTTMTRKAALASRDRLMQEPEVIIQSR